MNLVQEILQFSKDYKHMSEERALDDFHHKIEHFMEQYEPINSKEESTFSYIKVFDGGELNFEYSVPVISLINRL